MCVCVCVCVCVQLLAINTLYPKINTLYPNNKHTIP